MPSFAHYCYEFEYGFTTAHASDPPLEGYINKWGVNLAESRLIDAGVTPEIVDGELVVTAPEEVE